LEIVVASRIENFCIILANDNDIDGNQAIVDNL